MVEYNEKDWEKKNYWMGVHLSTIRPSSTRLFCQTNPFVSIERVGEGLGLGSIFWSATACCPLVSPEPDQLEVGARWRK
jgi:hypothetical protein